MKETTVIIDLAMIELIPEQRIPEDLKDVNEELVFRNEAVGHERHTITVSIASVPMHG